ncbi:nitroreductase/quinone reductase family protein [Mycolicibacterium cosmeticum]|uniref:nitroreductase/quinone reductase family protein n=1 Tax=Mycolicibacterium cosmeticum TaxID=258533 RepID=UPI00320497E5
MGLDYVDPNKKHTRAYDISVMFARTRLGRFYGMHIAPRIDPWLYKVTSGRYPAVMGMVLNAPLQTTGARSGQQREVHVVYFHDGPDPIVIASYGGEPRNPQWYYNLKAHPDCRLGGEEFVATEIDDPEEYARLFDLAQRVYAGFGDYRAKMAAVGGRRIPVFRLTAR